MTKAEIEYRAKERFGQPARVFPLRLRFQCEFENWWALVVGGMILGARRTIEELPGLVQRGPVMDLLQK